MSDLSGESEKVLCEIE